MGVVSKNLFPAALPFRQIIFLTSSNFLYKNLRVMTWTMFTAFLKRKFGPSEPQAYYTEKEINANRRLEKTWSPTRPQFRTLVYELLEADPPPWECKSNISRTDFDPNFAQRSCARCRTASTTRKKLSASGN